MSQPASRPSAFTLYSPEPPKSADTPIEVDLGGYGLRFLSVAEYDAIQRQREDQQLWARRAPAVEALTTERSPDGYPVRIVDIDTYDAQMRALIGLE